MAESYTTPSQQQEAGPQTPSGWYKDQIMTWAMLDTLLGGTVAMRKAEQMLMPKYPNETPENYEYRLRRATLLNYFKRTLNGLVGKPFSDPITKPKNLPQEIDDQLDDVDRQGSDLDTFARHAFRIGLAKGLVHILVDYPNSEGVTTLADEKEAGLAPYMVALPPESVIAAFCEYEDGVEKLTHVRIRECEVQRGTEDEKWEEKTIERIRVLEPGTWTLYEKKPDGKYEQVGTGATSLDYIPMVTFYAEREGFMRTRPPLLDLAHLNVAHWQSSSDQRNILSVGRFPILAASGVDPETTLTIGPNSYFAMRDPGAKLYYIEHGGASIAAGRQDLEDLKTEMAMMGLQLLMPQTGAATATAKAMDGAEANCGLQSLVLEFQASLNNAIEMMADWLGIEQEFDPFVITTEFGLSLGNAAELTILTQARQSREISHEAFVSELIRRGVLPKSFDLDKDQGLVDDEKVTDPGASMGFPPGKEGPIPFGKRPPFGKKPGGEGNPTVPADKGATA